MRVRIDKNLCAGNGLCEEYCPTVFKVDIAEGKANIIGLGEAALGKDIASVHQPNQKETWEVPKNLTQCVQNAELACPTMCIYIDQ